MLDAKGKGGSKALERMDRSLRKDNAYKPERAFVIGEKGLIEKTGELEKEYGELCRKIRDGLTGNYSYGRNISKAIRVISLMQGFLGMSKILAEDEELYKMPETQGPC